MIFFVSSMPEVTGFGCLNFCRNNGFNLAGMEGGNTCCTCHLVDAFINIPVSTRLRTGCSNVFEFGHTFVPLNLTTFAPCNTICEFDSFSFCGGPSVILAYSNGIMPVPVSSFFGTPAIPETIGSWFFFGCFQCVPSSGVPRALLTSVSIQGQYLSYHHSRIAVTN